MMTMMTRRRWTRWLAGAVAVTTLTACGDHSPPTGAPSNGPLWVAPSSAGPSTSLPTGVPSTTAGASSTPRAGGDCVAATLAGLTLPERVGQLLMIGTAVDSPGDLNQVVEQYHIGGAFLHGRSIRSAVALHADIDALQKHAGLPLLISLDQEGGEVQTLKGPDFPLIPTAVRLGAGPSAQVRTINQDSARRLAGIGVTLNLAPVADTVPTSVGKANPPIGAFNRQFGSDPVQVAADIRTVVRASQGQGVLTVLKHFPGLGRVLANTDTSTDAVDTTTTAHDPYLQPFAAGIAAGSAGVMVSSASYPKLDRSAVAAFSKPIITGLLRDRLGFTGLVLSDDLGAGVAVEATPVGQRGVRFVAAGGDLVLTIRPEDAAPMAAGLLDKAGKDRAFAARVTDAATHVLRAKQRAGLLRCNG